MKNLLFLFILTATLFSCAAQKNATSSAAAQENNVVGKVQSVERGKDGYTARILTADSLVYYATISIPNLNDPKQYKEVEAGMSIQVKGDYWEADGDRHITVRELIILEN